MINAHTYPAPVIAIVMVLGLASAPMMAQQPDMPVPRFALFERWHVSAGLRSALRFVAANPHAIEFSIGPEITATAIDNDPYERGDYIQYRVGLTTTATALLESRSGDPIYNQHDGWSITRLSLGVTNVTRSTPTSLGMYYSLGVDVNLGGTITQSVDYLPPPFPYEDFEIEAGIGGIEISVGLAQAFTVGSSKVICLLGPAIGAVNVDAYGSGNEASLFAGLNLVATYVF